MSVNAGSKLPTAFASSEWGHLNHAVSEWWNRVRLRRELESLDGTMLRDIGLYGGEMRSEASKSFWMN